MLETSELYPGVSIYKPMLVLKAPKDASELMSSGKYIAQPKMDGYWYQLVKTAAGEVYLFSRSTSKKTGFYAEKVDNVPHIKQWAEQLPNDTILIGEVYYPGGTSKNVTSIMGSLPEKAVKRQEGEYGLIHYYIHDIVRYAGKDYVVNEVDFEHRYSNLCEYIDIQLDNPDYIEIAVSKTGFDMEDTICRWMENGVEGAVVKSKAGLYLPGKRRREMFKIKQHEDSLDFIITNILPPEKHYTGNNFENWPYIERLNGELMKLENGIRIKEPYTCVTKAYYYGWAGAFEIGLHDGDHIQVIGTVASGMNDAIKEDAGKNPQNYLGQVVEVSCMSIDKDKLTLRHPIFMQVRGSDSKDVGECTLESVFG